jgi:hypothetical protein
MPRMPPCTRRAWNCRQSRLSRTAALSACSDSILSEPDGSTPSTAALNKVLNLRLLADYEGDSVTIDKAAQAVELAEAFVVAIKEKFSL